MGINFISCRGLLFILAAQNHGPLGVTSMSTVEGGSPVSGYRTASTVLMLVTPRGIG